MPNWCSNIVNITKFHSQEGKTKFIEWLESVKEDNNQGHLPKEIAENISEYRHMFYINDNGFRNRSLTRDYAFNFESKWAPPIESLVLMAKYYHFSFTIEYEESGCLVYGEGRYNYHKDLYEYRDVPENVWPDWDEDMEESYYDTLEAELEKIEFQVETPN